MPTGVSRPDQARSSSYDQGKLYALQVLLCDRLDDLLDTLGVRGHRTSRLVTAPCPVHGGDRQDAFNIYRAGESVPGYWVCQTRSCQKTFRSTVLGFVRGALSNQRLGWGKDGDEVVKFGDAVGWCCDFVGQKFATIKVDPEDQRRRALSSSISTASRRPEQERQGAPRKLVRSRLEIPSPYFLARGYPADLLDKYDIGTCVDKTKPFYGRVIVPVYDAEYKGMIGFTGRSTHEECPSCSHFHDGACPGKDDKWRFTKWRNSDDFHREASLFNYWHARKHIRETGKAILVEGPPDVLALEAAGYRTSVGMYGVNLADAQQVILEASGALTVVVLTDQDKAGVAGAERLKKQLGRGFRVKVVNLPDKDAGGMSPEALRSSIGDLA